MTINDVVLINRLNKENSGILIDGSNIVANTVVANTLAGDRIIGKNLVAGNVYRQFGSNLIYPYMTVYHGISQSNESALINDSTKTIYGVYNHSQTLGDDEVRDDFFDNDVARVLHIEFFSSPNGATPINRNVANLKIEVTNASTTDIHFIEGDEHNVFHNNTRYIQMKFLIPAKLSPSAVSIKWYNSFDQTDLHSEYQHNFIKRFTLSNF